MKALITGGTGFVGSHLAKMLADQGHNVRVLHRKSSKLDALDGVPFESALGDITDLESLKAACVGCDWVFHVAAVADYWRADRAKMYDANVEGTRRVLQAAQEAGVKRVIFTSSAAAVGLRADGQPSDENEPYHQSADSFPYAHSKVLAEAVCAEAIAAGQDVVIVNPVVVLGAGDLNMISGEIVLKTKRLQWTIPVPRGGIAVIDVQDVARMHIAAAERGRTGERYILGTANYSHKDLFALVADTVGVARPRLPMPNALIPLFAGLIDLGRKVGLPLPLDANQTRMSAQNVYFKYDKAWAELCKPEVSIPQSVKETYDWYAANGYVKADLMSRLLSAISGRRG